MDDKYYTLYFTTYNIYKIISNKNAWRSRVCCLLLLMKEFSTKNI